MGGGASVCLLMGSVGREAWVSPPGRAATLAIGTFFRGNMLARGVEPRRGGTGPSARGGHSLHGGEGVSAWGAWDASGVQRVRGTG